MRSYGDDFVAGHCANGDQVLLGLLCPNLVLYRFDGSGRPIGREIRPWSYPAVRRHGIYQLHDPAFRESLARQLADWRAELGLVDGPIEVEQFVDETQGVGMEPSEEGECAFIFWWAKDYWMNEDGEVEST
jgi:hypothetical protein